MCWPLLCYVEHFHVYIQQKLKVADTTQLVPVFRLRFISTGIRGLSKDQDPDLDSGSFGKNALKSEWCIADPAEPY